MLFVYFMDYLYYKIAFFLSGNPLLFNKALSGIYTANGVVYAALTGMFMKYYVSCEMFVVIVS